MKKVSTFEDLADSLVLTACEERLRIYKEVKRRLENFVTYREQFSVVYDCVREVLIQEKSKIFGMYLLLFKCDYIDSGEYFRLIDETEDKFAELEKDFVSKCAITKSFGG